MPATLGDDIPVESYLTLLARAMELAREDGDEEFRAAVLEFAGGSGDPLEAALLVATVLHIRWSQAGRPSGGDDPQEGRRRGRCAA